jgi:alpha-ribazole phosphatase/probable phosphoglycerate mutase
MDSYSSSITVDLIRHGQPLGGNRFRGQLDDPLSEAGWEDMRASLGDVSPWTVIVSSPLQRCADFARVQAKRLGLACEIEARFKEIGFGEWEGRRHNEILSKEGTRLREFWANPLRNLPPGGESMEDFRARVVEGWEDLLREHAGGHVLLVVHAGVIRTLLTWLLGIPFDRYYRLEVPKARVSRIRYDDRRGQIMARLLFHGAQL